MSTTDNRQAAELDKSRHTTNPCPVVSCGCNSNQKTGLEDRSWIGQALKIPPLGEVRTCCSRSSYAWMSNMNIIIVFLYLENILIRIFVERAELQLNYQYDCNHVNTQGFYIFEKTKIKIVKWKWSYARFGAHMGGKRPANLWIAVYCLVRICLFIMDPDSQAWSGICG